MLWRGLLLPLPPAKPDDLLHAGEGEVLVLDRHVTIVAAAHCEGPLALLAPFMDVVRVEFLSHQQLLHGEQL